MDRKIDRKVVLNLAKGVVNVAANWLDKINEIDDDDLSVSFYENSGISIDVHFQKHADGICRRTLHFYFEALDKPPYSIHDQDPQICAETLGLKELVMLFARCVSRFESRSVQVVYLVARIARQLTWLNQVRRHSLFVVADVEKPWLALPTEDLDSSFDITADYEESRITVMSDNKLESMFAVPFVGDITTQHLNQVLETLLS